MKQLKAKPGKSIIVWGSLSLAGQLMEAGLADEIQLVVCPSVLGSGRPCFAGGTARSLRLKEARAFSSGEVLLCYTT